MSQAQLYISKRCPYCRQLLMIIQQRQDLKGQISIISIDENPFPKEIKAVPSMVVDNELWSAEDIFQFLSQTDGAQQQQQGQQQQQQQQQGHQQQQQQGQQGHQQQQQQGQQGHQQQQQQQQQQQVPTGDQELEGYCQNGVCGLSFSSIDGHDASMSNYSLLDDKQNSVPVENDGYIKKNDRANQFDSEYERLMEERGKMSGNGQQRH